MSDTVGHSPEAGFRILINGRVQGVGFRPHVWRTATALGLRGDVRNTSSGVEVRLVCDAFVLEAFRQTLGTNLPLLASLDTLLITPLDTDELASIGNEFGILPSQPGKRATSVLPDAASCTDCIAELFDPENRRYRYPFINCTHCGPRFSIINGMPYDRERTGMAGFVLCTTCAKEYADPADRRFHAQTNACPECGPRLWLETPQSEVISTPDPFVTIATNLSQGKVLALKGLSGFHLCCVASDPAAVNRLRSGKKRPAKALAVMFQDRQQLQAYVNAGPEELNLIASPQAPIVLMRSREAGQKLAHIVAPDSAWLGCMLPYTPVHHLLMAAVDGPLVMTSGNYSGMPQVIDNVSAREQLADLADLLVLHNRPIISRVDDSLMRIQSMSGQAEVLRPGRGIAPVSLPLPSGFAPGGAVLALGGDLKNTFCQIKEERAVISQYQGDLQQLKVFEAAMESRQHYQQLYSLNPKLLACDKHPGYISHQAAQDGNERPVIQVGHHHAHLASCLGEHAYPLDAPDVLGICLDGTGFGETGEIWGGELLYGHYKSVQRLAFLAPCALPGGEAAIHEPWRLLVAQLLQAGIDPVDTRDIWPILAEKPLETLCCMIERGVNAPLSSSAGRLFDAMAAALGCYAEGISYEGQAAIALEALAQGCPQVQRVTGYRFAIHQSDSGWQLDARTLWPQVVHDLRMKRPAGEMAAAFHIGLVQGLFELAMQLRQEHPFQTLVLSGGVMQNAFLADRLEGAFTAVEIRVLRHRKVPCNDSGLSLGQALVALAQYEEGAPYA